MIFIVYVYVERLDDILMNVVFFVREYDPWKNRRVLHSFIIRFVIINLTDQLKNIHIRRVLVIGAIRLVNFRIKA